MGSKPKCLYGNPITCQKNFTLGKEVENSTVNNNCLADSNGIQSENGGVLNKYDILNQTPVLLETRNDQCNDLPTSLAVKTNIEDQGTNEYLNSTSYVSDTYDSKEEQYDDDSIADPDYHPSSPKFSRFRNISVSMSYNIESIILYVEYFTVSIFLLFSHFSFLQIHIKMMNYVQKVRK